MSARKEEKIVSEFPPERTREGGIFRRPSMHGSSLMIVVSSIESVLFRNISRLTPSASNVSKLRGPPIAETALVPIKPVIACVVYTINLAPDVHVTFNFRRRKDTPAVFAYAPIWPFIITVSICDLRASPILILVRAAIWQLSCRVSERQPVKAP